MRSQMPVYTSVNENKFKRKNLTISNDSNMVGNNPNNNSQSSKYSNIDKETNNIMGDTSNNSAGYYKTENNYASGQRERYNLNRVPEAVY